MALENIKQEIETFIKSPIPQVLALSGAWGAGKTFIWKECVKENRDCKAFQRYRYVYTSASNCQNINELKSAILALSGWYKTKDFIPSLSIKGFSVSDIVKSSLGALAERITQNSLICIDDIERASDNINPYEILHYASYLRDEGNCKIILLLNENQIEEGKEKFTQALEKGTNQFLRLNLTAEEAGEIWKKMIEENKSDFPKNWIEPFLKITTELGMCNIRVLEHLATALKRWSPILAECDESSIGYKELLEQIILGTILTGWGHFEPELCLTWEDIRKRRFLEEVRKSHKINSKDLSEDSYIEKKLNLRNPHARRIINVTEEDRKRNYSQMQDKSYHKIKSIMIEKKNCLFSQHLILTEQQPNFFPECFLNIKNGYLSNVEQKIQDFIVNTEKRHEQERIENLFSIPQSLMFRSAGDTTDELKEALKTVFEENPANINLLTAAQFINFSQSIKIEKTIINNFIQEWTAALPNMPDNFFNLPNNFGNDRCPDDKLNWVDKRLLEPWKNEKDKRPNTFIKPYTEDAFIKSLKEGYVNPEHSIKISKEKWETIFKNKIEPFYYKEVLKTVFYHKNSHSELFQSLKKAVQELCQIPLYRFRFQTILGEMPDILEAYEIQKNH
ncbi:hypothetical protein FAI41_06885 [Acetobacteraceae bacterium]|nr:hypothetical protein FAI41_06885 [Acetobacteraceae bacterium]